MGDKTFWTSSRYLDALVAVLSFSALMLWDDKGWPAMKTTQNTGQRKRNSRSDLTKPCHTWVRIVLGGLWGLMFSWVTGQLNKWKKPDLQFSSYDAYVALIILYVALLSRHYYWMNAIFLTVLFNEDVLFGKPHWCKCITTCFVCYTLLNQVYSKYLSKYFSLSH